MALTDENSVLILGAGVSAPFGLPVGSRLIDTIAENLNEQLENYSLYAGDKGFSVSDFLPVKGYKIFSNYPYLEPLLWKAKDPDSELKDLVNDRDFEDGLYSELKIMEKLSGLLQNQTSDSIDDFIVMNEAYADHVKICIAAEFIKALYMRYFHTDYNLVGLDERSLSLPAGYKRPDGEIQKNDERNWIHRLINLIRLGVIEGKVTPENKVRIITFNYDTILEYVLEKQFLNTEYFEKLKKKKPDQKISYEDYIEIIHVHGQCGKLEKKLEIPSKTCWEWAQGIHVIRETSGRLNTDVAKNQRRIPILIKYAAEIYAAGFAFAKANTDLIGLAEGPPEEDRTIYYNNYSGDIGLRNAASKFEEMDPMYCQSQVIEEPKIGVSDWIGVGTLGELP